MQKWRGAYTGPAKKMARTYVRFRVGMSFVRSRCISGACSPLRADQESSFPANFGIDFPLPNEYEIPLSTLSDNCKVVSF